MSGISGIGGYGSSDIYGKLASGTRIMRAADDAAGQAISSKMEFQQRTQAVQQRNAAMQQDSINVADGARAGISGYVQDINSLSIQAMNGTYSDSDRRAIQNQIDQYAMGINDTVNQAKYNESNVISGTSARSLGLENFNVTSGNADLGAVESALASVSAERAQDGATSNGLSSSISNLASAAENTTAAMSRIKDLDIADGVSQQKKEETLQEASVSMQKRQMEDEQNLVNQMFGA